jgi:hypothetical protein
MPFPLLDTATELLTEIILPLLEARDVVALGRTCRQLHSLILDKANPESEFIWKTRINHDLRFPVWVTVNLAMHMGNVADVPTTLQIQRKHSKTKWMAGPVSQDQSAACLVSITMSQMNASRADLVPNLCAHVLCYCAAFAASGEKAAMVDSQ